MSRRPVGPDEPPGQPKIDIGGREPLPVATATAGRGRRSPWRHPAALLLAMFLLPPVGLILVWRSRSWSHRVRRTVSLLVVVAVLGSAVVAAVTGWPVASLRPSPGSPASPAAAGRPAGTASTPAPAATPVGEPAGGRIGATGASAGPSGGSARSLESAPAPTATRPAATARPSAAQLARIASAQLAQLPVAPRSYAVPYARAGFGQAWVDADRNGCDTRNDILRRDLTEVTLRPGTFGCVVTRGTLHDPYTGATVAFVRGGAARIEIDHVVSLADAWHTGALRWTAAQRLAFANDPVELLAVSAETNQAKADADAASWLPPSTARRCAFVARQIAIKARFGLWVTPAEHDALARVLRGCPTPPVTTARTLPSAPG